MYKKLILFYFICGMFGDAFATDVEGCGLNDEARDLAELIVSDSQQKRTELRCNSILAKAAYEKAQVMAEHGIVMHNLEGSHNTRLFNAGYQLPQYYGAAFSNQVEAIAGGYSTASSVWEGFKESKSHRAHLLGEIPFFLEQDEMGVGFYRKKNNPHQEYWVVYPTKGLEKDQN